MKLMKFIEIIILRIFMIEQKKSKDKFNRRNIREKN